MTVYARIGNLSEGGLFLRTSTPMERGARTTVRFGRGDSSEIEVHATVVWARSDSESGPPGMGLEFDPLDDSKREQLRRVISLEQEAKTPGKEL